MSEPVKLTRAEIATIKEGLYRARERLAQGIVMWERVGRADMVQYTRDRDAEYLRLIEKLRKLPEFSDTEE